MTALQGPPRPQKTGNAQVDSYLNQLYNWAYLMWYWQTSSGTDATGESIGRDRNAGLMFALEGEPGEDGLTIQGPQGPQGIPGLTIPGMDGEDLEYAWPGPAGARGERGPQGAFMPGADGADGADLALLGIPNKSDDPISGVWTPNDSSGAGLTLTVAEATYRKTGREVTVSFQVTYPVTASGANATIGGLPFTSSQVGFGACANNAALNAVSWIIAAGTTIRFLNQAAFTAITNVQVSGKVMASTLTYFV